MITLITENRDAKMSSKKLREEDKIPAVCYAKGMETQSFTVNRQDAIRAYKEVNESGDFITLSFPTGEITAKFKDIQIDAVSHRLLHLDFQAVLEK